MRILIIEDEAHAAERLQDLLLAYDPAFEIAGSLESVAEAVAWFKASRPPDLAFFDIRLADGLSFEIFNRCEVDCPVIFTTAYEAYALQAFKVYSIDYLLKPLDGADLRSAFAKLERLRGSGIRPALTQAMADGALHLIHQRFKNRFLVRQGAHLASIPVEEIACFYSQHKMTWLYPLTGKKYHVEYTLDQLRTLLDPGRFFRVNRQYIVGIQAIQDVVEYSGNRLKLRLGSVTTEEEIIVSRERAPEFREWLGA